MVVLLLIILFVLIFSAIQASWFRKMNTTLAAEVLKKINKLKDIKGIQSFVDHKQIFLKKMGADIFLKDGLTVSQWYLYRISCAGGGFLVAILISKGVVHLNLWWLVSTLAALAGWFILDLMIRGENKRANEAMMPDIVEMSRFVLYGKRGGQYIADVLKDSVVVVENKRLKSALIRLQNNLNGGMNIDEALRALELSFSSGEIAAFCTVIRSLQSTGQIDESLKTLESNIERAQVGVNRRRCVILENKTMMYVMMIAFDILAVILYCIIMKLLAMQVAF